MDDQMWVCYLCNETLPKSAAVEVVVFFDEVGVPQGESQGFRAHPACFAASVHPETQSCLHPRLDPEVEEEAR